MSFVTIVRICFEKFIDFLKVMKKKYSSKPKLYILIVSKIVSIFLLKGKILYFCISIMIFTTNVQIADLCRSSSDSAVLNWIFNYQIHTLAILMAFCFCSCCIHPTFQNLPKNWVVQLKKSITVPLICWGTQSCSNYVLSMRYNIRHVPLVLLTSL